LTWFFLSIVRSFFDPFFAAVFALPGFIAVIVIDDPVENEVMFVVGGSVGVGFFRCASDAFEPVIDIGYEVSVSESEGFLFSIVLFVPIEEGLGIPIAEVSFAGESVNAVAPAFEFGMFPMRNHVEVLLWVIIAKLHTT
jgi:hypothetical protein